MFDRVDIIDGFAVFARQGFGRAGLFEKRGVNLEIVWFDALPNAVLRRLVRNCLEVALIVQPRYLLPFQHSEPKNRVKAPRAVETPHSQPPF